MEIMKVTPNKSARDGRIFYNFKDTSIVAFESVFRGETLLTIYPRKTQDGSAAEPFSFEYMEVIRASIAHYKSNPREHHVNVREAKWNSLPSVITVATDNCALPKVQLSVASVCTKMDGNVCFGAYKARLFCSSKEIEFFEEGIEGNVNSLALKGLMRGLQALKKPVNLQVMTASALVAKAIQERWLNRWVLNGWKNAHKEPIANVDLWKEVLELLKPHEVSVWGYDPKLRP